MDWGGPEFVLWIIAICTIAGVMKTAIRAKHGLPDRVHTPRRRGRAALEYSAEMEKLQAENRQLTDRLEASEDRLAVLERIVTDKSYALASEIEALRDSVPALKGTAGRMMSWATAVVVIVAILVLGNVMRSRHNAMTGYGTDSDGNPIGPSARERELEAELQELRERVKVLERIATEDGEAKRLSNEIERLRDE